MFVSRALLLAVSLAPLVAWAEPAAVEIEPGHGVTFTSDDGRFATNLRVRLQLRDTLSFAEGAAENDVQPRRIRLSLGGHAWDPDLRWFLQVAFGAAEFEPVSPSPLLDAWIEHVGWRDLEVRAGQFLVPFDRARTIRSARLQMVDRPLVVQELSLARDVGIAVASTDLGGVGLFSYALGLFGGEGRNRFGDLAPASGLLVVGRLSVHPFGAFDEDVEGDLARHATPKLAVGIAAAWNGASIRTSSTTGELYRGATFDYLHGAADLVFKWRGFSLLVEVLARAADAASRTTIVDGVALTESSREAWGAFAQAGFFVAPRWEVSGRYGRLEPLRSNTDPALVALVRDEGNEAAAGVSWYLHGHQLKLQADFVHRWGVRFDDGRELFRVQVDATF